MPKQHPEVTDATAKSLYANAVCCAEPGCNDPLYRMDGDGHRVLNSRIAHICARSENGPRWDPAMDSDTNRSVGNLLVLCLFHADMIDKKDLESRYPAPILHDWKLAQLRSYDAAVAAGDPDVGWKLTDSEAREVITKSERPTVNVVAETIYVGGMGGGPLGSGGGGGVIGGGIAGRGGDGPIVILDGQPGQWPGGGGGGSGVLLDPPPMNSQVREAEGCGHAVVATEDASGPDDDASCLRLSTLMLANYIAIDRGGLLHIVHGAWSNWTARQVPSDFAVPVLCVIEAGQMESGTYRMSVELRAPEDSQRDRKIVDVVVSKPGTIVRIPVIVDLAASIGPNDFGLWCVIVEAAGSEIGRIDVLVKQGD
ncbi:hypothetical protein ACXPWS_13665 [Mycobacterium sp. BMJ-28]